jgi:hypothetical protein
MTLFRYKNGLLYTITQERGRFGSSYKAHPYKHSVEIGVTHTSHSRHRNFKSNMSMKDFEVVAIC